MKYFSFPVLPRRIFCRPWRQKVPVHFLLCGMAGALLISFGGGTLLAKCGDPFGGMILSSAAAALFLFLGFYLIPPPGRTASKIGLKKVGKRELLLAVGGVIVLLAGSAILTGIWQGILDLFHIPYVKEQALLQFAREGGLREIGALVLLTAVVIPLVEELVFRRCLYELLLKVSPSTALLGGALIFSAAHGFLAGLPGLFFIGVGLQILCNSTRNLWCSVIAHGLLNGSVILITCLTA